MSRRDRPVHPLEKLISVAIIGLLLVLGITLIYNGVHQGIVHQEIVSRPSRGAGITAHGARAVGIGTGLTVLGIVFVYGAAKLASDWHRRTRQ